MTRPSQQLDAALRFHAEGEEGPWVTLVHGGLAGASSWRHATLALARWARVLTYDLRGYGDNRAAPTPHTIAQHADDLVAVWDAARIERSHLVGFSMGGMIAQQAALDFHARVDRLVLESTAARIGAQSAAAFHERAAALEGPAGAEALDAHVSVAFCDWFLAEQPEAVARYRREVAATDAAVAAHNFRAIAAFDRSADLHALHAPTLVLAGAEDPGMGADKAAELAELIPGAEARVVPRLGHTLHVEAPSTFTYLLADFLLFEGGPAGDPDRRS
ncbi:MAG TPA: alpha/beta fold hydrolase [Conexibacter sp.]|jgi:3-oxoadipate enol-lactonase